MSIFTTVLSKSYPDSGRPQSFEVVPSDEIERITRLCEGYGYRVEREKMDENYTAGQCWDDFTVEDAHGFSQWRDLPAFF